MADGGRTGLASRRRARAASVVVPFAQPGAGDRLDLVRLVPSGRTLVMAFGILLGVSLAYWGARSSSLFAIERVEVRGAPPEVARDVQRVTKGVLGSNLIELDAGTIAGRVRALPSVAAASVDRAFPHTVVIRVAPVHPVGVVRRADRAWLVSGAGHVIREVEPRAHPGLARTWLPKSTPLVPGQALPTAFDPILRVFAGLREVRMPIKAKGVRSLHGELAVVPRDGPTILLGAPTDAVLKLAVAARVLPLVDPRMEYLDVSVPERPVAGVDSTLN